jgi:hypothetical protein
LIGSIILFCAFNSVIKYAAAVEGDPGNFRTRLRGKAHAHSAGRDTYNSRIYPIDSFFIR